MPKFLSILIGVIAIYETTRAAPNQQRHSVLSDDLDDLSVFDLPYELSPSRNTDSESAFNERDKRFFDSLFPQLDFFSGRQSSFSSYSGFTKKQYNQNKGGGGFNDVLRNPQDFWLNILSSRRPAAVYLPVFIQPIDCGCSDTNQSPDKNKEPTDINTSGDEVVTPTKNMTISFPNRFNDGNEDDDGRRPVSFRPQQPKRPIPPPPPFEHGSSQAGSEGSVQEGSEGGVLAGSGTPSNSNRPLDLAPSSLPESTPATTPSICDGAVVACCLQLNIANCFERQGCNDITIYGDPCAPSVVSNVLEKFQRYYKQRGINKSFYS